MSITVVVAWTGKKVQVSLFCNLVTAFVLKKSFLIIWGFELVLVSVRTHVSLNVLIHARFW